MTNQDINKKSKFSARETLITLGVLFSGLILTIISVHFTRVNMRKTAIAEFESSCNGVIRRIDSRLEQHAQLLRSGAALFAVSDTVTREAWSRFHERTRLNKYLPGIEGFGYSHIIPPGQLDEHIRSFREMGFFDYYVRPEGEREIYTSIIYIEPFYGRNIRAFGYDMFSEPVRRKAMEIARDSNSAMLSGKVTLVQEEYEENVQPGILMYVPVYRNDSFITTVAERRAAIKGWIYSPYRMWDLMSGIEGGFSIPSETRIHFKIYDDGIISDESLLYDSRQNGAETYESPNLFLELPVLFNGMKWTIQFTGRRKELTFLQIDLLVVLTTGIIISVLLFTLSLIQIRSAIRTREIAQLNKELEKLINDKDRFMTILSHDLKSPFTSILGFLEILIDDVRKLDIDTIEKYVNIINSSARHTYDLLEDLLMWTRSHSGKILFDPEYFSLMDLFNNVHEILKPSAEAKDITVKFYPEDVENVYADLDMLKAILRNLVSNAIKFTNKGGSVTITAEKRPTHVTIIVSDTGIGIQPDVIKRLFDIKSIVTTSGTENEQGSGLGLVLCKEFIDKHGGKLWVESEPGKGSDFKFTLPFAGFQS